MHNSFYMPDSGYPPVNNPYAPVAGQNQMNSAIIRNSNRGLRSLSKTAGICVLGFIGLQYAVTFALQLFGLADDYMNNLLFQTSFGVVYSVVCVFAPFLLVAVFMDRKKQSETLLFGKPFSAELMLLAVPAGFMFCMFGNYATNALVTLMNSIGVTLTSPEMPVPDSVLGMVMYTVQIAFIPSLVEEFALRGVIMQPLRKYGDRFAIVMSAIVFALMHGNMVQAPFAFIAGITIGYFVISTGSIWTGVLIHFFNNLFSSIIALAESNTQAEIGTSYAAFLTASFVFGIACCVIFALNSKRYKLRKPEIPANVFNRAAIYIFTFPMIAALAAITYLTMNYIAFGG